MKRVLLVGGCQMQSLGNLLQPEYDCAFVFRRPIISMMSDPIATRGTLDFNDRHSEYIWNDLRKEHLTHLARFDGDVLIFDVLSDIRCPMMRLGSSFFFDPNRMLHLVADAPSVDERRIDLETLLAEAGYSGFDASHGDFIDIWKEAFDRFYQRVLLPQLERGCVVINQQIGYASPMRAMEVGETAARDAHNAALRAMHAHVATYPGVGCISIPERMCVTADDAPFGEHYLHPIAEVFQMLADQARRIIEDGCGAALRKPAEHLARLDPVARESAFLRFRRLVGRTGALVVHTRLTGFDQRYYLHWYKDVVGFRDGAVQHYIQQGWREGRDPSASFSTSGYLAANPDVAALDICPLLHFIDKGFLEGRGGWQKRNLTAPAPTPTPISARKQRTTRQSLSSSGPYASQPGGASGG